MPIKILIQLFAFVFACGMQAQIMNVRGWAKSERDSLEMGLALLQENKGEKARPVFEQILSNHPNEEFLKYTYAKCALQSPDRQAEAYKYLNEVFEKNKKAPEIYYYLALSAYQNYNYDEAVLRINTHLANKRIAPVDKQRAEVLKARINYARYYYTHPTRAKVTNLGSAFNSANNENAVATNADEAILFYCSQLPKQKPDENTVFNQIMYSTKTEGELNAPQPLNTFDKTENFKIISISNDASIMFLAKCDAADSCDLYESFLNGTAYSKPIKIRGAVNTPWQETYCSISPNKQSLYFSSNKPGGKGGKDLYRATFLPDSSWGHVVNLGDSVNTAADEETPFIHADGKTLFFSSAGRNSMGGFDVFKATMQVKDSSFKKADNLGSPINTPGDELYFTLSAAADNAYLSSNRKDGKGLFDLYHVEPNIKGFKPSLCLFKGIVYKNDKPVAAQINIEIISPEKKQFSIIESNPLSGNFLVVLPTGAEYQFSFTLKNYKQKTVTVDLQDMLGFVEKNKNINFDAVLDSMRPLEKSSVNTGITPTVNTNVTNTLSINNHTSGNLTSTVLAAIPDKTVDLKPAPATTVAPITNTVSIAASVPNKTLITKETAPTTSVIINPAPAVVNNGNTVIDKPIIKPGDNMQVITVKTNTPASASEVRGDTIKKALNSPDLSKPVVISTPHNSKPEMVVMKKDSVPVLVKKDSLAKNVVTKDTVAKSKQLSLKSSTQVAVVVTNSISVKTTSISNTGSKTLNDNFEPNTAVQEKMMMNAYKYGEISYDSLEFRVQVSAFKNNQHYYFPKLEKFGKIEKVELGDGYKRLMLGGSFKTYGRAFAYAKKVIRAGHDEVFIVVVYKGYRYSVEDLEEVGIFK